MTPEGALANLITELRGSAPFYGGISTEKLLLKAAASLERDQQTVNTLAAALEMVALELIHRRDNAARLAQDILVQEQRLERAIEQALALVAQGEEKDG